MMVELRIRDLDEDLHRAARIAAFEEGVSLKQFVIDALREKLERRQHEHEEGKRH